MNSQTSIRSVAYLRVLSKRIQYLLIIFALALIPGVVEHQFYQQRFDAVVTLPEKAAVEVVSNPTLAAAVAEVVKTNVAQPHAEELFTLPDETTDFEFPLDQEIALPPDVQTFPDQTGAVALVFRPNASVTTSGAGNSFRTAGRSGSRGGSAGGFSSIGSFAASFASFGGGNSPALTATTASLVNTFTPPPSTVNNSGAANNTPPVIVAVNDVRPVEAIKVPAPVTPQVTAVVPVSENDDSHTGGGNPVQETTMKKIDDDLSNDGSINTGFIANEGFLALINQFLNRNNNLNSADQTGDNNALVFNANNVNIPEPASWLLMLFGLGLLLQHKRRQSKLSRLI